MDINKIINGGFLSGKKTYITALLGIITLIANYLTGDIGITELLQTIFPLLGIVFLRNGVSSEVNKNTQELISKNIKKN